MGNKIITEKDFWMCTGGAVPAQLQTTQLSTKKVSEHKYITVADKATSSWIDFGCKKLMLLMAILAAVIAALIVATGGAALAVVVAAGAAAGAAGAAFGAIIGGLICGQKAAAAREWLDSKSNLIIQGQKAITGDHKMICHLFGDTISFAPHIKNWWQAISIGAANYIGGILEGMLAGAAVGFGVGALFAGGSALAAGGMRGLGQAGLQFLKQAPMNVLRNFGASFGYAGGFTKSAMLVAGGLRGAMGLQSALTQYGNSGELSGETAKAFGSGVFGMETGLAQSVKNIASGQASWQDIAGLALMLTPVHENLRNRPEADTAPRDVEVRDTDAETRDNEDGTPNARNIDGEAPRQEGEFEAFESQPIEVPGIRDFSTWFDNLTPEQFDAIWADEAARNTIKARIRHPGGLHEWLMVARTDVFKRWGVSMNDIKAQRTNTRDVIFTNPDGRHGGPGSTRAHNEILNIIDNSTSYDNFRDGLREWADRRLEGGRNSLPEGLR